MKEGKKIVGHTYDLTVGFISGVIERGKQKFQPVQLTEKTA